MTQTFYTVSQISYYIKELLREDQFLTGVWVRGELSSCRYHSSGHLYLTLNDEDAALRCVMFRRQAANLQFELKQGMDVLVFGAVSLYEKDGSCQLYAEEVLPAGDGAQAVALEQLKQKLAAEGLFLQESKKPLPLFASQVAVVTSGEGAAWADIQRVAAERWSGVVLRLYPCLVQGEQAPSSIAAAIKKAADSDCDVMIVGRGGGSEEDLSAFNSEVVVRAAAAVRMPLISAVGHESDYSLLDLAADVRAATPTHAAQLAVPDAQSFAALLQQKQKQLTEAYLGRLQLAQGRLDQLASSYCFTAIDRLLEVKTRLLQEAEDCLSAAAQNYIKERQKQLYIATVKMQALSPTAVLGRGYSISLDVNGNVIRDAAAVDVGDAVKLTLATGALDCLVTGKTADNHNL